MEQPIGERRKRLLRIVGLTVLGLLLVFFAYCLRTIFNAVLVGFLLAYVFSPVADWLEQLGLGRVLAIVAIYAVGFLVFLGAVIYGLPMFVAEAGSAVDAFWGEDFVDTNGNGRRDGSTPGTGPMGPEATPAPDAAAKPTKGSAEDMAAETKKPTREIDPLLLVRESLPPAAGRRSAPADGEAVAMLVAEAFVDRNGNGRYDPGYLERIKIWVDDWIIWWNKRQKDRPERRISRANVTYRLREVMGEQFRDIKSPLERLLIAMRDNVYAALGLLGFLLLAPIYAFFFLLEMHSMKLGVVRYLPAEARDRALVVIEEIHQAISSFFHGRLLICVADALLTCPLLYFSGVRFWLLLSVLTGILGIVPIVGPLVAFIPMALLSVTDNGFMNLLVVTVLFWSVQGLDGFVMTPLVVGAKVRLHPVTLIIALLVGGELFGAFGVLAAVPVACILKILGRQFILPHLRALATEGSASAPSGAGGP